MNFKIQMQCVATASHEKRIAYPVNRSCMIVIPGCTASRGFVPRHNPSPYRIGPSNACHVACCLCWDIAALASPEFLNHVQALSSPMYAAEVAQPTEELVDAVPAAAVEQHQLHCNTQVGSLSSVLICSRELLSKVSCIWRCAASN